MSGAARRSLLAACCVAVVLPALADEPANEASEPEVVTPTIFHVVVHSPGKAWKAGTSFQEQPGVMAHVEYMSGLLEAGTLAFGGPFLDDSGGMALLRGADLAEARRIAGEDPSVKAGLLEFEVVPWMVAMAGEHP